MFDNLTKKLAKKMGQSVKEVAQPIRTEVAKTANNKVDLWSRLLKLGVLVFLFVDGTRRVVQEPKQQESSPNHIVINNYINGRPPYSNGNGKHREEGGKNGSKQRT